MRSLEHRKFFLLLQKFQRRFGNFGWVVVFFFLFPKQKITSSKTGSFLETSNVDKQEVVCGLKRFFDLFFFWKKLNYNKIERKRCWVGFGQRKKLQKLFLMFSTSTIYPKYILRKQFLQKSLSEKKKIKKNYSFFFSIFFFCPKPTQHLFLSILL